MPKKKNIRKAPEDNDEQMISEVFKSGIGTVRKLCKNKNAAKICDLEGVILKRRKAATQDYLDYVRERHPFQRVR